MTRDEVLALAREVGLWEMLEGYSSEYGSLDAKEDCLPTLERFVSLAKAHEREECAEVALTGTGEAVQIKTLEIIRAERERIANAIRSRT